MPDIGLLQRSRPRVPPRALVPEVSAMRVAPTREVAAPFAAPVAGPIAVISAAPAAVAVVSAPGPAPEGKASVPEGTPPMVSVGGPPPIRWSDLLWLALALFVIVGTGLGIRDPWPADEPRPR